MISATIKFYLLTVKIINVKMRDYVVECLMWFTVVVHLLNILIVCLFFFHLILFALVTKKYFRYFRA